MIRVFFSASKTFVFRVRIIFQSAFRTKGRRPVVLFLFLTTVYSLSFAQSDPIDSLIRIVGVSSEDSSKVNLLTKLGRSLLEQSRYAEARGYLSEALALGLKLRFKDGTAFANYYLGSLSRHEGNTEEALRYWQTCLSLFQENGNKSGMARTYNRIASLHDNMGNDSAALENYSRALELATEAGDKTTLVYVNSSLGLFHDYNGNYPDGMKHYLASLKMAEEIGDKFSIAAANMNIGCIESYWGNYQDVLDHNMAALEIWNEMGNKYNKADALANIGEAYANLCNEEEAERYTLMAIELGKEIGNQYAIGAGLTKMGIISTMKGDIKQAVDHYLESLKVWEEVGDKAKIAATLTFVGTGYFDLQNFPEAIKYYNKALAIAKEIDSKLDMADAYKRLYLAQSEMGNFQEALKSYESYTGIQDQLWNETSTNQVIAMKEQFESEKKDQVIELLNKEKTIQSLELRRHRQARTYFIAGLGLLAVVSLLVYWNYHTRQQVKLLTLRNKIASDLHDDVGSTLSSIYMFSEIARQQSKETIPALETIAESSKSMLDAMTDIVWTINPQNDQFEKIIMRMRSFAFELLGSKHIDFEFVVDEQVSKINLPMEARRNLYLIFKESINNMAKYAEADKAMLAMKGENNALTMLIRDNGKGFDVTQEFEGNGLKNIKKRASEIGAELNIDSTPGSGTSIRLELAI